MIVYASRTGNVEFIVNKLGLPNTKVEKGLKVNEPFFIFTYTDGLGSVPLEVRDFMKYNFKMCKGVIASGNVNFNSRGEELFCKSATELSYVFKLPIIRKIDLRGDDTDYNHILKEYNRIIVNGEQTT